MKTLFYNAKVYTGEGFAKAFLVNDTKIEEVYDQIPELNNCEKVDLHGHFVCAGFNDSHMHLLNFCRMQRSADHADKGLRSLLRGQLQGAGDRQDR